MIFFAFHNCFPIILFIYTIVISRSNPVEKKRPLPHRDTEDAIVHSRTILRPVGNAVVPQSDRRP